MAPFVGTYLFPKHRFEHITHEFHHGFGIGNYKDLSVKVLMISCKLGENVVYNTFFCHAILITDLLPELFVQSLQVLVLMTGLTLKYTTNQYLTLCLHQVDPNY